MKLRNSQYKIDDTSIFNYYELAANKPKLLMLHAQGTDSLSYMNVAKRLSKYFHIYLVDYYGHGGSSHNRKKYDLISIGNDVIDFIHNVIGDEVAVVGHSSGGLIAAYVAANCGSCKKLFLEDPPFFSSWGERRFNTYNYKDLSSVCHSFIEQEAEKDFVYYYFTHQYCWNFFPENVRENLKKKLGGFALKYRTKHPDKNLKVRFWPKKFLQAFKGLQHYDPYFGEAFYIDSFNNNVDYHKLLTNIQCETLFMKANTTIGEQGLLQGALSEEDLKQVNELIKNMTIEYYDCGHNIHGEKSKQFIKALINGRTKL